MRVSKKNSKRRILERNLARELSDKELREVLGGAEEFEWVTACGHGHGDDCEEP